jgi:DNA-binding NtrC family response regulator
MKKILIVDDLHEYVDSLSRALSGNYLIEQAYSLEEAKKKMNQSIKMALVDVRLSEQDLANRDGLLFLSWIKSSFPGVPLIMMSAYRDFESAVEALNLGAAHYLKKPINLHELKDLIASLMEEKA